MTVTALPQFLGLPSPCSLPVVKSACNAVKGLGGAVAGDILGTIAHGPATAAQHLDRPDDDVLDTGPGPDLR